MPTFNPLDSLYALAAITLRQLWDNATYSRAAGTSLEDDPNAQFDLFNTVNIKRPKLRGQAQDVDPRTGEVNLTEQEWVTTPVSLNHKWSDGFPAFLIDARADQIRAESLMPIVNNIGSSFEKMFYEECFRDYSGIPSSGVVQYGDGPPVRIVFEENSAGGLTSFGTDHLIYANATLEDQNVPSFDRFAFTTAIAGGDWASSQPIAEGQSGAMAMGGQLLMSGMQQNRFMFRAGFNFGVARSVSGQTGIADLGDTTPTEPVSAFVQDTTVFFDGDRMDVAPLGAVRVTIGVTAALNPAVAVGQIARLGPDAGPATAYGVILRVDTAGKFVWLVPCDSKGQVLTADQLSTSTDKFGIPRIRAVNTAHQREFLQFASRPLRMPMQGSGGLVASQLLPDYGVAVNYAVGAFSATKSRQDHVVSLLCGCQPADHRKAVFMLSA